MSGKTGEAYEGFAIVEIMGHRRLAGRVSQAEQYGVAMLRLDVPGDDAEIVATQFYGGGAIYALTPTTEEIAREIAKSKQHEPVTHWELRALAPPAESDGVKAGCPECTFVELVPPKAKAHKCFQCGALFEVVAAEDRDDDGYPF